MKQERKKTKRDLHLDGIVKLIHFDKQIPEWKFYKVAGWILRKWSYETTIAKIEKLDFTDLIKGNGFNGIYGFLRANLITAHFEKKAEIQKAKHFKPDQKRKTPQDDFMKRSRDRLKTLTSMRTLYPDSKRRDVEQEINLIKNKLRRYE